MASPPCMWYPQGRDVCHGSTCRPPEAAELWEATYTHTHTLNGKEIS
jgi:hypothetical protein